MMPEVKMEIGKVLQALSGKCLGCESIKTLPFPACCQGCEHGGEAHVLMEGIIENECIVATTKKTGKRKSIVRESSSGDGVVITNPEPDKFENIFSLYSGRIGTEQATEEIKKELDWIKPSILWKEVFPIIKPLLEKHRKLGAMDTAATDAMQRYYYANKEKSEEPQGDQSEFGILYNKMMEARAEINLSTRGMELERYKDVTMLLWDTIKNMLELLARKNI